MSNGGLWRGWWGMRFPGDGREPTPYITTLFPNFRRITAICPECIISWLAMVMNAEATLAA